MKRHVNLIVLLLLAVFIIFSVNGAFMGARRAQGFFNSAPMMIFWGVLLISLLIGFLVYASLRKRLSLMLIHAGCLLVLIGGMIGSERAHKLTNRLLGQGTFTEGQMNLNEGQSSHRVVSEENELVNELPFAVRLEEAFVEYYDKPLIGLDFGDGVRWTISAQAGKVFQIPDGRGTIQVVAAYKNFKMKQENGQMVPYESTEPGFNPAYQLVINPVKVKPETLYVFEKFPMHAMGGKTYRAEYIAPQMVKDYKSVLQIVKDGEIAKQATIEVNKPLYYGGYHFYQHTFAHDQSGSISGIMVVSARGVWLVFVGYAIIFLGVVMRFWPKLFTPGTHTKDVKEASDGI